MRIDTDNLNDIWAYLTPREAYELMLALNDLSEEQPPDPDWHHHFTGDGHELTLAVESSQPS
jgi:hypothetical protein